MISSERWPASLPGSCDTSFVGAAATGGGGGGGGERGVGLVIGHQRQRDEQRQRGQHARAQQFGAAQHAAAQDQAPMRAGAMIGPCRHDRTAFLRNGTLRCLHAPAGDSSSRILGPLGRG